jgi:tRNA-specific 2-thiouridylase
VDGPDGAELHRAVDRTRDQSWFLFATTRNQLATCLFPLGDMADKRAVRNVAQRLGLGVAEKPDSQDICFVPSGGYADVVGRLRPDALEAGEIVTADGLVVGRHDGIARYTVGQGKRLGDAAMLDGERQVVVATEPARRRVVVGRRGIGTREVRLRDANWLMAAPRPEMRCAVKLRARDELRQAVVRVEGGTTSVLLDEPALPAPGQACVFYDGDRVLGGGIMMRAEAGIA